MRWFAVFLLVALTGCAQQSTEVAPPTTVSSPSAAPSQAPFPTTGRLDYQLGGSYPPPAGTTIVARDSTELPEPGVYSICYLNGFQTQPGEASWWKSMHPELLLTSKGKPVHDPDWPDEILLDTSTNSNRAAIVAIEADWISDCATRGFDAVEFDNLDTYSRSGNAITIDDNIATATGLVEIVHAAGLAAAQKNSVELGTRGRDEIGFDFVVAEECQRYDECGEYSAVYGTRVIDIEYFGDLGGTIDQVCSDPTLPAFTVFRDLDLVPSGSPDYRLEVCA
jgi:hypothetical protein